MFEKNYRVSWLLDFYGNMLTDKQQDAIDLYYNEDLSLAEIADFQNISRQGVRDAIKRGEEILEEMENNLGLAEKMFGLTELLREINILSSAARKTKNQLNYYKVIEENINIILEKTKEFAPEPEKSENIKAGAKF